MRVVEALKRRPFSVVGHRGAAGQAPENTLRALREAIESGADAAEFDVQVTGDGVPIVFHDEDASRVAGVSLNVRRAVLREVRALRVSGEPVPTLAELLEESRGRIPLLLEIKNAADTDVIVGHVERSGMVGDVMLISFHPEALRRARELNPRIPTGLIYYRPPGMIVECKRLGCDAVLPRHNLATEKAVALAHRLGLIVVAWTVNDPARAIALVRRGVDAIATDYPRRIARLREQRLA